MLPTTPSSVAENSNVWRDSGVGGDDLFDIVDEAHVEHAVGFVTGSAIARNRSCPFQVVDQAARCGDKDFRMAGQHADLHRVRHAAQDRDGLDGA